MALFPAPGPPAVLFAQDDIIYFEYDTTGCVGIKDFQAFYTIPGSGTLNQATQDLLSTKNAPGGGTLLRFYFLTAPSTNYDFFSRAVYSSKIANSAFTRQRSNGVNPPPALPTVNLYADDSRFSAKTVNNPPLGLTIFGLFKAVGEDQYESQPVGYTPNQPLRITYDLLTPDTEYQYFLQTRNADGITNGPVTKVKTQALGCPIGQPELQTFATFPVYYQINDSGASISFLSSFADVDGDNLECVGALIDVATGQETYSTINEQDNVAKRSNHTFNNLNFNARYNIFSVVRNPQGIQGSTTTYRATTVLNPFNPTTPTPGFTGIVSYTEKVQVSGLSNESFIPGIQLTIEVSPDREFTASTIEDYTYTRLPANPTIIISDDDLPEGQIRFVRSRLFSPARNSIRYSNVFEWDGVITKKK